MKDFIGEEEVIVSSTEFKDFTKADWAMYFIENYAHIDGSHHKQWVLDQVARVLLGAEPVVKLARWESGAYEYRVSLGPPPKEYWEWLGEYDEEDFGVAP